MAQNSKHCETLTGITSPKIATIYLQLCTLWPFSYPAKCIPLGYFVSPRHNWQCYKNEKETHKGKENDWTENINACLDTD